MSDLIWDGLTPALMLLALVVGAIHYVRQPPAERRQATQTQRRLAQRLARHPGAVLIKGQPRRALWRMLPLAALGLILALGMPYARQHGLVWLCDRYGAEAASRWIWAVAFYVVPALLACMALAHAAKSIRVLRGGYSPPLDSVTLHDTVAVTGWRAQVDGVLGLVVPPLAVACVMWLGHDVYQRFSAPGPQARLAQCPSFGGRP